MHPGNEVHMPASLLVISPIYGQIHAGSKPPSADVMPYVNNVRQYLGATVLPAMRAAMQSVNKTRAVDPLTHVIDELIAYRQSEAT